MTLVFAVATLALAVAGLYERDAASLGSGPLEQRFSAWAKLLFDSAVLLTLDTPADPPRNWWFSGARLTAVAFFFAGFITILLSISTAFRAFVERSFIGLVSFLRPETSHAVVIGLGRIGIQLVRDLRARDHAARGPGERRRRVIALVSRADAHAAEASRLGALVLSGNVLSPELRDRARIHLASALFIVCEDDTLNIDLAGEVLRDFASEDSRLKRPSRFGRPLQCYVHVGEPQTSEVFRTHDLFRARQSAVDFHVFNTRDNAARQLLRDYPNGLARRHAPADDEVAHYFLFGFGEMAQTVALHMARLAHFRNRRRLRLTILDDFEGNTLVKKARDRFLDYQPGFCPDLSFSLDDPEWRQDSERDAWAYRGARPSNQGWRFSDPTVVEYAVNAEFIEMRTNVDAPDLVARLGARLSADQRPRVKAAVVVCFDDDRRNFKAAYQLRDALARSLDERSLSGSLPIYVYLPADRGLSLLLGSNGSAENLFPLYAFGQLERGAGYQEVVRPELRELARRFHDAYTAIEAERRGSRAMDPGPGLTARAPMAPAFQTSNENAAAHADIKLDAIGYRKRRRLPADVNSPLVPFSAAQREVLAQIEHNRWMADRLVSGWRHGPRDDRRKRRPSFLAWENLRDSAERAKDESQIRALVRAYEVTGWTVVPDGKGWITAPNAEASAPSGGPRLVESQLREGRHPEPGGTIR